MIIALALVVAVLVGFVLLSGRPVSTQPRAVPGQFTVPPQQQPSALRQLPRTPKITETDSVSVKGRSFQPTAISVKAGALVTWTNYDLSPHTVTGRGFDSGVLSEGSVWSHIFTKPGRYEYHDAVHPEMKGIVDVR